MSSLKRELVFHILQFLDEEKFKETAHKLEQESGLYFSMNHLEEEVMNGRWDEIEKYFSGFITIGENKYSMSIFFEIRKQKYLEALDRHDRPKAVEILVKDLKLFSSFNENVFKTLTEVLFLKNIRDNENLRNYGTTETARAYTLARLKRLIEANPVLGDKLQFPTPSSRLRTLVDQKLRAEWSSHSNR